MHQRDAEHQIVGDQVEGGEAVVEGVAALDAEERVADFAGVDQLSGDPFERALAKVQGDLGLIPQEAADEIVKNCELSMIVFRSVTVPLKAAA
mgnify:CR=1 FL=1